MRLEEIDGYRTQQYFDRYWGIEYHLKDDAPDQWYDLFEDPSEEMCDRIVRFLNNGPFKVIDKLPELKESNRIKTYRGDSYIFSDEILVYSRGYEAWIRGKFSKRNEENPEFIDMEDECGSALKDVTHWMHMPEAPL